MDVSSLSAQQQHQGVTIGAALEEPDLKRRKTSNAAASATTPGASPTVGSVKAKQQAFYGALASEKRVVSPATPSSQGPKKAEGGVKPLKSAMRPVSPPPKAAGSQPLVRGKTVRPKEVKKETLNPRMIAHDPAGHGVRLVLLKKLHEGMERLNKEVLKSDDPTEKIFHLSPNELVKLALDEEEQIAKENRSVYGNIIKMRILKYTKKMTVDEWIQQRKETVQKSPEAKKSSGSNESPPIETGLTLAEELLILPRLVADQTKFAQWGYVTSPPSEAEIEKARLGVEAAHGYEECDRCRSRFQVFPNRREEDGALTTGGMCTHHPLRRYFPPRDKADKGPKEAKYGCCHEVVGSPGCTHAATHVFKISEAKRLAHVMPFISTPPNPTIDGGEAVCFDCEMGYTCFGMELIRLTAVSWPSGKPLIDILVKPLGIMLDLNTRFSGVKPEVFAAAKEFDPLSKENPFPKTKDEPLRIVSSPHIARALLLKHVSPTTPLLGHALENDLNSIRLVHPTIVDTVVLFPHPRGLPLRFGLKSLADRYLQRAIQTAGAAGHDSLEDARATGDLVRVKIGNEWKKLKSHGWSVKNGAFYSPDSTTPSELPILLRYSTDLKAGVKRKRADGEDGPADTDEDKE